MILQYIGLPASGKTKFLKNYLASTNSFDIQYVDVANSNLSEIHDLIRNNKNKHIIIESACGISLKNSLVVKVSIPRKTREKQWVERESRGLDLDYESLLQTAMLPATFTVTSDEAAKNLLDELFNK